KSVKCVPFPWKVILRYFFSDDFDYFGAAAHVGNEQMLVKNGEMTEQAYKNRMLLTTIMKSVGFVQHPKEWWHFHKYTMAELKSNLKLLNF
ncbi:MAG: M15 family metallopeptidase, partial [Rikenellaceae bacterium]